MEFTEIIEKVNSDKRLVPDLMKSEKGNNFRAISESAILDVIDPVLKEAGWFYTVEIKKSDLQIREAYGSKGKKLQFIATVEIKVKFVSYVPVDSFMPPLRDTIDANNYVTIESVGMGIDDNDKAMGKAYTYALKYALLKIFRLRYGDDPDAKASEPLNLEPKTEQKEKPISKNNAEKKENNSKNRQKYAKNEKTSSEKAMTEAQRDYILGLMKQKGIDSKMIMSQFDGCDPVEDEFIPMKVARSMIKFLEDYQDLPF